MELLDGRPESMDGRLPREVRTYDLLDSLGIEYKRTDHERTDTMEACKDSVTVYLYTFITKLTDF